MKLATRFACGWVFLTLAFFVFGMNACSSSEGTIEGLWTARAEGKKPGAHTTPRAVGGVNPKGAAPLREQAAGQQPGAARSSPTPDAPHPLPTLRSQAVQVTVKQGETLKQIAARYQVSVAQIVQANTLPNPDLLSVGQVLNVPGATAQGEATDFKIIPDSEFVYSPYNAGYDLAGFIQQKGGYLAQYQEDVNGKSMNAAQVVEEISRLYSINPLLLLAALEYQSGWVSNPSPNVQTQEYALGFAAPNWRGLYAQLNLAASSLARGYYLWRVNGIGVWVLNDGSVVMASPYVNAGTAAVQNLFSDLYGRQDWEKAISADGLAATYTTMFGYPFDYALEPLVPEDLQQPQMQLPFEKGVVWAFTGGPHGGWSASTGWAALDFAPPAEDVGCLPSNDWVTAMADGLIVHAENGEVIQDLDGDGVWQTGWSLLYMHVESRERVQVGTQVRAGERIGHPSCEGGVSTGTHVHVARRYNGEWIAADGKLPFVLDGWVSGGAGAEYDGTLSRGGKVISAYEGRSPENEIQR